MRRRSSLCCLQLRALVTADATNMSHNPRYRPRSSWRRDFSDGPPRDNAGGGGGVSGDSHIRSVGQANHTYRQFDRTNFPGQFQGQPYRQHPPLPYYRQQPPPYYGQQPPPYRQPPPPYRHPRPVRPANYKPADYRNWEYAVSQLPPHCEQFIVVSYNILADYLAINHRRELYFHIPRHILDWEWRKKKILFELGLWSPDIMCLQEVDRFQDLDEELKLHGYSGIWKMRTGIPVDGCAIFWRTARFNLMYEESIEYNRFQLRDNVAQICVLELRNKSFAGDRSDATPPSSYCPNRVVVCNTHVLYNPRRGEIKLGQVRMLLDRAHAISKLWDDAPVIICGDFNCTPKSPLYNFISEQKLDLTGLARDQVSGQSSGEIHRYRPYTPNSISGHSSFRAPDDNLNQASTLGEKRGFAVEQTDCIPDIRNHDKPIISGENPAFINNLHESQCATRVDYASNIQYSDVKNEEESSMFRAQDVDISNQVSISGEKKGFDVEQTDCSPNIHNHDKLIINRESLTFTNNLHKSQNDSRLDYATNMSSSDVKNEEESSAISYESSKETQQVIDSCKNKLRLSCYDSVEPNDSRNDDLQDQNPPMKSCENRNYVDVEYEDESLSGISTDCSCPAALTTESQSNSDMRSLVASTLKEGLVHDDTDEGNTQIKVNGASSESHVYFAKLKDHGKLENAIAQDIKSDSVPDSPFFYDNKVCHSESLGNSSPCFTNEEIASTFDKSVNVVDSSDLSTSDSNKNQEKVSLSEQSCTGVDSSDVSTCNFHMDSELLRLKLGEVTKEDGSLDQTCTSTSSSETSRTEEIFRSDDDDGKVVIPESGETDQYSEENSIAPLELQLSPGSDGVQGEASFSDPSLTAKKNNTYDPSSWTPMEIEIASGNAECTLLEHPLKLKSTYTEVEDRRGTRDSSREPQITSYNTKFKGTVDYIWCSEGLQTVKVLDTIPKHALQWTPGFPTPKWGSDHFALASQLAFTKGIDRS